MTCPSTDDQNRSRAVHYRTVDRSLDRRTSLAQRRPMYDALRLLLQPKEAFYVSDSLQVVVERNWCMASISRALASFPRPVRLVLIRWLAMDGDWCSVFEPSSSWQISGGIVRHVGGSERALDNQSKKSRNAVGKQSMTAMPPLGIPLSRTPRSQRSRKYDSRSQIIHLHLQPRLLFWLGVLSTSKYILVIRYIPTSLQTLHLPCL